MALWKEEQEQYVKQFIKRDMGEFNLPELAKKLGVSEYTTKKKLSEMAYKLDVTFRGMWGKDSVMVKVIPGYQTTKAGKYDRKAVKKKEEPPTGLPLEKPSTGKSKYMCKCLLDTGGIAYLVVRGDGKKQAKSNLLERYYGVNKVLEVTNYDNYKPPCDDGKYLYRETDRINRNPIAYYASKTRKI